MPRSIHDGKEADAEFRRGVDQFNRREFFGAHETWEEIWLTAPQPEKTFLQGIIQVAAAFHHYTRKNHRGMQSLLEAGLKKLERFPAARHRGIELGALRTAARRWLFALAAGESARRPAIPKIRRATETRA